MGGWPLFTACVKARPLLGEMATIKCKLVTEPKNLTVHIKRYHLSRPLQRFNSFCPVPEKKKLDLPTYLFWQKRHKTICLTEEKNLSPFVPIS